MSAVTQVLIYGSLAGLAIPLGALLSQYESIRSPWVASEVRHGVAAFGAGALLAAIALVLVPDGIEKLALAPLTAVFFAGGILYLMFQDIAPTVSLEKSWLPPMGALLGFYVGIVSAILVD